MTSPHDTDAPGTSNVIELRPRGAEAPASDSGVQARDDDWSVGGAAAAGAPLEHQLEALLFVSPTPLSLEALAELTGEDVDDLHECLLDMMHRYSDRTSGIVLERVAGGWAFRASDHAREVLARLCRPQADTRLSPSALETLAIVAYMQPISRPEVARIRGVSVDAAMAGLLERGLVEEAGRSDTGAVMFRTTAMFERAFGLASLDSLPELDSFRPGTDDVAELRQQLEQMAAARVE